MHNSTGIKGQRLQNQSVCTAFMRQDICTDLAIDSHLTMKWKTGYPAN
jgi:hypothetical protein